MSKRNLDLDLLRGLIDALEAERERNNFQDKLLEAEQVCNILQTQQINRQEQRLGNIVQMYKNLIERLEFLENEVPDLRHQVTRSKELEYWVNSYSQDGDAICNS